MVPLFLILNFIAQITLIRSAIQNQINHQETKLKHQNERFYTEPLGSNKPLEFTTRIRITQQF